MTPPLWETHNENILIPENEPVIEIPTLEEIPQVKTTCPENILNVEEIN